MKNNILTLLLLSFFISGYSQNSGYEYNGRTTPSIKKEKLNEARCINEIMPGFFEHFTMEYSEMIQLSELLKIVDSSQGYYAYPRGYVHIQKDYEELMDYALIEISTVTDGKTLTAKSTNELLTPEQKNILNTADFGTDICVKIKFSYKKWASTASTHNNRIKEGIYTVTVVPQAEAEYPGGFKQLTTYLTDNIINKVSGKNDFEKVQQTVVKFTVSEQGRVAVTKLLKTYEDPKIDKLIQDAMNKMPVWKPAKNSKGIIVKQEFNIPLGNPGC